MKIDLTIEQINVILAALQDAPIAHKHTDPVIRHLVQQVQEASKPAADPAPADKTPEAS